MERRLIMIKTFIMKEKKNRIEFGSILLIKILLNLQLKRNIEAAFAALIKKLKKNKY